MNIGQKIKSLRIAKMLTQNELAGDNITRNMLSRIENGFAAVPDAPGLSIESLNEELIEKFHKKDTPAPWSDTSHWDGEWANDRIWS